MRDGKVTMTRPLCPHPQVARYKGRGDRTTPRASSAPRRSERLKSLHRELRR